MTHGFSNKTGAYKWAKHVKHNLDINIPEYTRMHQLKSNHRCPRRKSKSASQDLKNGKEIQARVRKINMKCKHRNRAQVKAKTGASK
jgi:hypothetical protein